MYSYASVSFFECVGARYATDPLFVLRMGFRVTPEAQASGGGGEGGMRKGGGLGPHTNICHACVVRFRPKAKLVLNEWQRDLLSEMLGKT